MKRKLTSLFLVAGTMLTMNAQVMINEHFTSPFNAATAGWVRINNSATPVASWAQGTGTVFPAFTGGPNDYYRANFGSSGATTPTTISNWLITPTVNLTNGGVIEFATRTTTNPATWTVYSATVTGLSGATVGRLGFRYHVTSAGPAGANSDYIGLDAVRYY